VASGDIVTTLSVNAQANKRYLARAPHLLPDSFSARGIAKKIIKRAVSGTPGGIFSGITRAQTAYRKRL